MAIVLWRRFYKPLRRRLDWRASLGNRAAMTAFFKVNRDIFFRTLCLVAVTLYFTSAGASQGEVVLAVNTLLMQLFTLFSYVMDGFAYAGEALAGKYIGARNETSLHRTVRQIFAWGGGLALLFVLLYGVGGEAFLSLLTDDRSVIAGGRLCRLYVGRHLHRCHGHAGHAAVDVCRITAFFRHLSLGTCHLWQPCFVGSLYRLPLLPWCGADAAGTKSLACHEMKYPARCRIRNNTVVSFTTICHSLFLSFPT